MHSVSISIKALDIRGTDLNFTLIFHYDDVIFVLRYFIQTMSGFQRVACRGIFSLTTEDI